MSSLDRLFRTNNQKEWTNFAFYEMQMPGMSYWEKSVYYAPQDVIIVGGGFCGLWTAISLLDINPALNITILERGRIPTGASTRNAGFSCFGSPSEILGDFDALGAEKLWRLVEMRYKGLQKIRKSFPDDAIGYENSGGFECFSPESADWELCSGKLDWINEQLKAITGEDKTFTRADHKRSQFGLTGFSHLLENRLEGGINPAMLIKALERKAIQLGAQIINNLNVTSFETRNRVLEIDTSEGIRFSAARLVLCTNAFTRQLLPEIDIRPCRGQVWITRPLKKLFLRGTFHFDRGFYYFRNVDDHRLLLGGARNKDFINEDSLEMTTTETIQEALEQFARKHLLAGQEFEIEQRWSGIMAMGSEKMPIVQAVSDQVYACVRMSGMGVALAPVVGEQIAGLVMDS